MKGAILLILLTSLLLLAVTIDAANYDVCKIKCLYYVCQKYNNRRRHHAVIKLTFRKMNSIILKILLVSFLVMSITADSANFRFQKMDCVRFTCHQFKKCYIRCSCYCKNMAKGKYNHCGF